MAQIQPVDIVAPGAAGLNTERKNTLMAPQWATVAQNAVVNRSGRLAARLGWADQTTTGIAGSPGIKVMHEYLNEAGASVILSTASNKIYKNISDFTDAANDITSSTAPTADNWKFINFNNKVLGFQKGHTPITWAGSGDFTDASYTGTGPDGNEALAAFGRVWAVDADLQTIRISKLLDDTIYDLADDGHTIDMSSVWTNGMDEIVALAAIGANFVVFGKNHIVMWADGSGSEIGLSPTNMHVVDTIEGTGCICRDSVQATGEGDLIYLSRNGLQSLGRVIQFKSNPIISLTKNVRTDFLEVMSTQRASDADFDTVRSAYSPEEGIYVINFPQEDIQYCLDIHHPFSDDDDEIVFPVTTWTLGGTINALLAIDAGDMYVGSSGVVGKYSGRQDDTSAYIFDFETGWLDFGELNHRLKMLKEIVATVLVGTGIVEWKWEFDFSGIELSRQLSYATGVVSEWGIAEWGNSEFAGGVIIKRKILPAHGEGQFLKLGCKTDINSFDFVIQQMSIAPKIGRMVT
jgi:hypothetical protein